MHSAPPPPQEDLPAAQEEAPISPAGRASRTRLIVAGFLALVAAIAYLCRTSIAPAEKTIREDLGLSESQMGFVTGPAFFWAYALAQIPTAWLCQRYGPRRVLPLLALACSLAIGWLSLAGAFAGLALARIFMGIAQAGMFPCATYVIARWHPRSERALASGLLTAFMQVGHVIAIPLTGIMMVWLGGLGMSGWRWTFAAFAVPGVIWAMVFYAWFRNEPSQHPRVSEEELKRINAGRSPKELAGEAAPTTPWLTLMGSRAMWLICGQQFFRAAGQVFFATWFVTYLQEAHGLKFERSAWMAAAPVLAIMFSCLLGGAMSDQVYRLTGSLGYARKGVAVTSLLLCAAIVGSAYFATNANLAVALISAGVFFAGFAGPCAYAVTMDMGGRHVPAVFSTMNMMGNIGAGVFPWIVPAFRQLVDERFDFASLGGSSWDAVLLLFASMYLAAALCWMRLRVQGDVFERPV